jgi:hypothetical protein
MGYEAEYDTDVEIDGVDVESPGDEADFTMSEDGTSASNNIGSTEPDENPQSDPYADRADPESERGRFAGESRSNNEEDEEEEKKKKNEKEEDRKPTDPIWFDVFEGFIKFFTI